MKPLKLGLLGLWGIAAIWGGVAVVERFTLGHRLAAYGSYVPWGLWVAAYIYFIGLSAGAFLVSSLVYAFGVRRLEPVGRLALLTAVVTLFMALLTIWFDIGHMERFWKIYTRPQFHSMMAWMVWLYTAYFLLLIAELYLAIRRDLPAMAAQPGVAGAVARLLTDRTAPFTPDDLRRDDRRLRILGGLGVPLALAFHGGVGALFGTVVAQILWHSPIYPILFLSGALASGSALLTLLVASFWPRRDAGWADLVFFLGRIVLGLVLFDLVLEWAEYSIPMWYGIGPEHAALLAIFTGPFWYVFWIFRMLLGAAVPILLLVVWARSAAAVGVASLLVSGMYLAVRLNLVIPSLVTPQLRGLEWSYRDARLTFHYVPSLFEWQLLVFVAALGVALLYLGYRLLPLTGSGKQKEVPA